MAYFRPSMLPAAISDQFHGPLDLNSQRRDDSRDGNEKNKEEPMRPLTLFSIDMSHLSPMVQYLTLACGLIIFMCLYGYYQELVIYGWFDRKLSMFSTFLHFLGCLIFAQIQRNLSRTHSRASTTTGCVPTTGSFMVFTLGTAPPRVALFYYLLLIFVRTGAQGMSNLSMTQINYPAKVLFKSASPIITMIIGLVWFKKSYPLRDYIVVLLLVLGLYVFITGDATASPQSTKLGIFYVVLSMFGSAGIPMIQEHCMLTYNSSIEDLLYHTFLGSAIASFVMSCVTGELLDGILFLVRTGSLHAWFIMFAFTMFGFVGTNFSAGLTLQYGSLVNGITNTFRKALTMGLSFLLFPERNLLTSQKIVGSAIFFCGLLVRIFSKSGSKPQYKNHSDKEGENLDIEAGVLRSATTIIETNPKSHSLSVHTTYFGNNASTDFGQLVANTDEDITSSSDVLPSGGSDKLNYVDIESRELLETQRKYTVTKEPSAHMMNGSYSHRESVAMHSRHANGIASASADHSYGGNHADTGDTADLVQNLAV